MNSTVEPNKRIKAINIRFKPNDVDKLKKLADAKGLALSTYCYLVLKNLVDNN